MAKCGVCFHDCLGGVSCVQRWSSLRHQDLCLLPDALPFDLSWTEGSGLPRSLVVPFSASWWSCTSQVVTVLHEGVHSRHGIMSCRFKHPRCPCRLSERRFCTGILHWPFTALLSYCAFAETVRPFGKRRHVVLDAFSGYTWGLILLCETIWKSLVFNVMFESVVFCDEVP